MKKILAYSRDFQQMYFNKDVFLIPYYIARGKSLPLEFCYGYNMGDNNIPSKYRGADIKTTKRKRTSLLNEILDSFIFIFSQANQIDTLFVVGMSFIHLLRIYLFKRTNSSGNVVVFGDMEPQQAEEMLKTNFYSSKNLLGYIKNKLADYVFKNSILLVANPKAYSIMSSLYKNRNWKGLLHFYPCIDDESLTEYNIKRIPWIKKENLIVCVGRIGNIQKNTEMLLAALNNVDLQDWKIYMIGPMTDSFDLNGSNDFHKVINIFFENNPQYKDRLIFTGPIRDQKILFNYYNRAKVMLMTSRHESFGNVYSEAAAFGCFIVSTDVGGASFVSNNWRFGIKVEQEDSESLSIILSDIVNNRICMKEDDIIDSRLLMYSNAMNNNLLPLLH